MAAELDLPVKSFKSSDDFEKWMEKNHGKSRGIWLRFFKKASGKKTVVYAEALDVALCYGWIDALVKSFDEESYVQRFTPRRSRSMWSKRNRQHVARLIKCGRMREAWLKQIQAAKRDGRWKSAYDSPRKMAVPRDFLAELAKSQKAKAFYDSLTRRNTYAIAMILGSAKKPETRQRRMKKLLEMMERGQKLY